MPKVSVIIPVYNVEKYLRECMDSVVNQTLKDIEIICVDDGSTDNSRNILKEYSLKDSRIKIIEQNINLGQSSARNKGIDAAKSQYIMFLDSDDWIDARTLELTYNKIIELKCDILCFGHYNVLDNKKQLNWMNSLLEINKEKILYDVQIPMAFLDSSTMKIYNKSFINKYDITFPEGIKTSEDGIFNLYCVHYGSKFGFLNETLYYYRKRLGSITYSNKNAVKYDIESGKYLLKSKIYAESKSEKQRKMILEKIINNIEFYYYKPANSKYRILFSINLQFFLNYLYKNYDNNLLNSCKNIKKLRNMTFCNYLLKTIFSIVNSSDTKHKVITILGFKININRYFFLNITNHKIDKNKIVFSNYLGKSYGCNPKYITEEILKRNLPYKIVWLVNEPKKEKQNFPQSVKLVKYYSIDALKELLSAKVWVDNTRKPYFWDKGLKKNPKTKYIQTWHGTLGMKKIEAAIKEETPYWRSNAKIDSKNIDYLLTTSETDKKFMRQSFWYDGEILVSGYPRNDILYSDDQNKQLIKEKVYEFLGINKNSKFILYVPTFRDDGRTNCFTLDYERILKTFEEKYNCSMVLGTRFHPNNFDFANKLITYSEKIMNATIYPDIMELLIAADVVITDYSSCIFDFMHLKRPAFIFATDIEQYEKERGFYFPLDDTPFSIAQNNDELVNNINNFDYTAYQNRIVKYMQENGYADDGHASERIVDLIEKIMNSRG